MIALGSRDQGCNQARDAAEQGRENSQGHQEHGKVGYRKGEKGNEHCYGRERAGVVTTVADALAAECPNIQGGGAM